MLKICDFSANMYHMNMIFPFLESLLLGLSLECFLIIFAHFFEILRHFEFDVYFWDADSFSVSPNLKNDENHLKYHSTNIFFVCLIILFCSINFDWDIVWLWFFVLSVELCQKLILHTHIIVSWYLKPFLKQLEILFS